MWTSSLAACIQAIPQPPPVPIATDAFTVPTSEPLEPVAAAVLGWAGLATVTPGGSWVGTESQVALDESGTELCAWTWGAQDWATAHGTTPDVIPEDCADGLGNPCDWQATVVLSGGHRDGENCRPYWGFNSEADGGSHAYGWIADWKDSEGSHGTWFLQRTPEGHWIPVDPSVAWDPDSGRLSYFIPAE